MIREVSYLMAGKEKQFEMRIRRYIESKGGFCVKYFGCAYSTSGIPDLICTVNGHFLAIEVKADTGKPSELQLVKIADIRKAGGFAYVAYPTGWKKLKDIIDGLLIDKFNREEDVELR